ncbi:MAG: hypothetical protein M1817_001085 [Caeruleum heppii]|nr:MAG: hypothetical protein M1817_001085 [Caeruleum heppii]
MDPTVPFPATPGMALWEVSAERANIQKHPQSTIDAPHSPCGPDMVTLSHDQNQQPNLDVSGKVAKLDHLGGKEAADSRKQQAAAALRRAVVGREEAENDNRRMRELLEKLREEVEEGRNRERRVGERLESVMEDLHRTKSAESHSHTLYEKELRRARKETFKSSSALVKLQEELKSTRSSLRQMTTSLEQQRLKTERKGQEAFQAEFRMVGLQQDLDTMGQRIKLVEEERDALKTNLKEEEVARIAAEGRIALPVSREEDDEFASPKKTPRVGVLVPAAPVMSDLEEEELEALRDELNWERRRTRAAEEQVEFLKLECRFGCCSCRLAGEAMPGIHGEAMIHSTMDLSSAPKPEIQSQHHNRSISDEAALDDLSHDGLAPDPTTTGHTREASDDHQQAANPTRINTPVSNDQHGDTPNHPHFETALPTLSTISTAEHHEEQDMRPPPTPIHQYLPSHNSRNDHGEEEVSYMEMKTATTRIPLNIPRDPASPSPSHSYAADPRLHLLPQPRDLRETSLATSTSSYRTAMSSQPFSASTSDVLPAPPPSTIYSQTPSLSPPPTIRPDPQPQPHPRPAPQRHHTHRRSSSVPTLPTTTHSPEVPSTLTTTSHTIQIPTFGPSTSSPSSSTTPDSQSQTQFPLSPRTMTREEALAAIRNRRGRARSFAASASAAVSGSDSKGSGSGSGKEGGMTGNGVKTPRKFTHPGMSGAQMGVRSVGRKVLGVGMGGRRDISAPVRR